MAARIRHRMLSDITERLDAPEGDAKRIDPLKLIDADVLRLMKDSEDRAHGTPKATTELTGADGGPVALVRFEVVDPPKRE